MAKRRGPGRPKGRSRRGMNDNMSGFGKGKFSANFKEATKGKTLLTNLGWAFGGALTWLTIPTALGLTGWGGFATAFGTTWLLGIAFNKKEFQYGAFAVGAVQTFYALFSAPLENIFKKPIFMLKSTTAAPAIPTTKGLRDGNALLQPNTQVFDNMNFRRAPELEQAPSSSSNMQLSEYMEAGKGVSAFIPPTPERKSSSQSLPLGGFGKSQLSLRA